MPVANHATLWHCCAMFTPDENDTDLIYPEQSRLCSRFLVDYWNATGDDPHWLKRSPAGALPAPEYLAYREGFLEAVYALHSLRHGPARQPWVREILDFQNRDEGYVEEDQFLSLNDPNPQHG